MSTNYYATLVATHGQPRGVIHLGKTSGNSVSLSGLLFGSLRDMERFLKHGENHGLQITSETMIDYSVEEFVRMLRAYPPLDRERQYRWTDGQQNWLDPEGFTFSGYDFC